MNAIDEMKKVIEETREELNKLVGTYNATDSENTTFKLVINQDGSGTFEIDHQTNDEQDKSLTFDKFLKFYKTLDFDNYGCTVYSAYSAAGSKTRI